MIPVISIVGYANSGKTTLIVKLIRELKDRGYRVAAIKHHHRDVEMDIPGKDTWKHAEAGADTVVLACPGKLGIIEKIAGDPQLDEIIRKITGADLIITEGFKRENKPKIEVLRQGVHMTPVSSREELLAVAGDVRIEGIPGFDSDDIKGLADFLVQKLLTE
ncbi:MAG: molybdopterin-guanine dinucleotide biosynthesis protein B [Firmicutes bacterium HGW-Firmicutes-14]|nr:MAG: molybdopterin-guanine dinucleotide biosynthesis protein B [Firmicutes bacterium HGW-Firmicutes-14]